MDEEEELQKSSPTTDKKLGVEDDLTEQVESLKTRKDVAVRERKKERRNVLLDGEDHFDECTTCIIKQVKRLFTNTAGEEEGKERSAKKMKKELDAEKEDTNTDDNSWRQNRGRDDRK